MQEQTKIDSPWLMMGDCIERMKEIPNGSVDLIASDLPYGTTRCAWDSIIPLDLLWPEYRRILSSNGTVVLTSAMPFTAILVVSNLEWFKYDLVWAKNRSTGHLNANRAPLRSHESIVVFSPKAATYNPQKTTGHKPVNTYYTRSSGNCFNTAEKNRSGGGQTDRFPSSIVQCATVNNYKSDRIHPTQKPVTLFEYIIKTYSNPGDTVLDNCFGGGTTGIACANTGRRFIGIEKDLAYYRAGAERIQTAIRQNELS